MEKIEEDLRTMYTEYFEVAESELRLVSIHLRQGYHSGARCRLSLAKHAFRNAAELSLRLDKYRNKVEKNQAQENLAGLLGHLQGAEDVIAEMIKE